MAEESKSLENSILQGDFESAVEHFSRLLEKSPMDRTATGGFYIARFWANRQDLIALEDEGKNRASFLMQEWSNFEREIERRRISDLPILRIYMRYIFAQAARNLRLVFHKEGGGNISAELLEKLGYCLLQSQDYANAMEILEYSRSLYGDSSPILFYLAESCFRSGNIPRSKLYYREALLGKTSDLNHSNIQAHYINENLNQLKEAGVPHALLLDWVFIYCSATRVFDQIMPLKPRRIEAVTAEIAYLENQYNSKDAAIQEKLSVYLMKKYLYLMDYFKMRADEPGLYNSYAERLEKLNEKIMRIYRENRKGF